MLIIKLKNIAKKKQDCGLIDSFTEELAPQYPGT